MEQTDERTNRWSDRMQTDLWPAGGKVDWFKGDGRLLVATLSSYGRWSAEFRWTGCKQMSRLTNEAGRSNRMQMDWVACRVTDGLSRRTDERTHLQDDTQFHRRMVVQMNKQMGRTDDRTVRWDYRWTCWQADGLTGLHQRTNLQTGGWWDGRSEGTEWWDRLTIGCVLTDVRLYRLMMWRTVR